MTGSTAIAQAFEAVLEAGDRLERLPQIEAEMKKLAVEQRATSLIRQLEEGLHPDHIYNTKQAARFLGMAPSTLGNIPGDLLPHKGGRWRGIDIMAYRGDITYEEAQAYKEAKRETVLRLIKNERQ